MNSDTDCTFAIYKLYLASAEKISDRRLETNKWFAAIVGGLAGTQGAVLKLVAPSADSAVSYVWLVPLIGCVLCVFWWLLLTSFRTLNQAKFMVLQEVEQHLAIAVFDKEHKLYTKLRRRGFSVLEQAVPLCLGLVFFAAVVSSLAVTR